MNLDEAWQQALKNTAILRARVRPLETFETTRLPYIFLAASLVNRGDTVVRKGEVFVEKPAIILPEHLPQFGGFELEEAGAGHDFMTTYLMVRGIRFPSLKYQNKTESLDVFEGHLEHASGFYRDRLAQAEDVQTGLVTGVEDCWQFSILILMAHQILRQADGDIRRLMEKFRREAGQ